MTILYILAGILWAFTATLVVCVVAGEKIMKQAAHRAVVLEAERILQQEDQP